jgi:hypothetical protein
MSKERSQVKRKKYMYACLENENYNDKKHISTCLRLKSIG